MDKRRKSLPISSQLPAMESLPRHIGSAITRRRLLAATASVSALVSGCLFGESRGIDVRVTNGDERPHTIDVSSSSQDTEKSASLKSGESVVFDKMISRSDHTHEFVIKIVTNTGIRYVGRHKTCHYIDVFSFEITDDHSIVSTTRDENELDDPHLESKLAADDGHSDDNFGSSVAMSSGTTAIIGANRGEDPNGEQAGSAYVFQGRTQEDKLTAADGDGQDNFGSSVAVSRDGTTAFIGANKDENANGDRAGSVYVFQFSGLFWNQQAKLAADDGDSGDLFGGSVAVSSDGTTALIGANKDDDPNGTDAGSVYVFQVSDGSWTQQAKLAAADGDSQDKFGSSMTVSGDGTAALIGAYGEEDPNGTDGGSVYVFQASDGSWTQQAKLAAADGDSQDKFGSSVAMSNGGTTAIIGAYGDEDPNGEQAGSAYVFQGSGGSWTQQAKLAAADGDGQDNFGSSVAMSSDGNTAIIGANRGEDPNGEQAGSAYVFQASDGSWTQQSKLAGDDSERPDNFGSSVAVSWDGTTAIIGADKDNSSNGTNTGSAYVFDLSPRC